MAKYSVPDEFWEEEEPEDDTSPRTYVNSHEVDVIHVTDPTETMGYGRDKYTAHIVHDEDDGPYVLYFVKHRWKGNYWRDILELDWLDVPQVVKRQVAAVVACDGVDDLDPGHRLVDEGGQSTWKLNPDPGESEAYQCPGCDWKGQTDDALPDGQRWCPNERCAVSAFTEVADVGGDASE